jgi:hypothetical protein
LDEALGEERAAPHVFFADATKRPLVQLMKQLAKRWFVMRDMHAGPAPVLLQPRYAMTYMRGPLTRNELMRAAGHDAARPSAMCALRIYGATDRSGSGLLGARQTSRAVCSTRYQLR